MRILVCCADWGIPLGGSAGSSVHLRCLAKALAGLGHEVRLVVSNAGGAAKLSMPVEVVAEERIWPAVHALIERVRGRAGEAAVSTVAASAAAGPAAADAASQGARNVSRRPASGGSWKSRLYYETLPQLADQAQECLFHPIRFGRAVSRIMACFQPDAVYERYALCQAGASRAVRAAGGGRVPHVLEVNASLADERFGPAASARALGWWSAREEGRLWRRADRVVCVSEKLGQQAVSLGADPARVRVMPNGVDLEAFRPDRPKGRLRRLLGVDGRTILIGWLGALSPGRGGEEFLRVLAQALPLCAGAAGVVIGGGPLEAACRRLAGALGIAERVRFVGPVDHDRIPDLLVDVDIAVSCYPGRKDFYFSPMKVAEYLACGLPVVSGRTGSGREAVADGVNGLLVDPGVAGAWGHALARLCRDPDLRARLGRAARQSALAGPTWIGNARVVEQEIMRCRDELAQVGRRACP
ncbi:glycosyltransferase family 4 protein [Solidesulfovibrio sp.]|uniref:glycosyltransferase family 4 protein n=1 Tax=Solidesulfovibrio sp. TaxID=2910990 RepID=UPI0026381457|nr:glycosyltransferase family 4 protein [Solidesulfovibrio sp.]